MQSDELRRQLLELGRQERNDDIARLPGAGIHAEVLRSC